MGVFDQRWQYIYGGQQNIVLQNTFYWTVNQLDSFLNEIQLELNRISREEQQVAYELKYVNSQLRSLTMLGLVGIFFNVQSSSVEINQLSMRQKQLEAQGNTIPFYKASLLQMWQTVQNQKAQSASRAYR